MLNQSRNHDSDKPRQSLSLPSHSLPAHSLPAHSLPRSPKLTVLKKRDEIFKELERRLKLFDRPVVSIVSITTGQDSKCRLYRIELPKTKINLRLKATRLDQILNKLNKSEDSQVYCIWKSPSPGKSTSGSNHAIWSNLKKPALSSNHINLLQPYTDLTHKLFASLDSLGVRKDNKPVDGDIDDVFCIEEQKTGYHVIIGFADITRTSRLNFADNMLKNSLRFGYSLYSEDETFSMLGKENERSCSLLEGKYRYIWALDFNINHSGIDESSFKVYRAKIFNSMQMDYNTRPEDTYTPELALALTNIRRAASLINSANPLSAKKMLVEKAETANDKTIAEFMIHSRHLLGKFFSQAGYPAIYRIQYLSTTKKDLYRLRRVLHNFHCSVSDRDLSDPNRLSALLVKLLSSEKPKDIQAGINISDYLLGKACYSCDPLAHEISGFEPYSELKGLRKLSGFINQHILDAMMRGVPPATLKPIVTNLCRIANARKSQIHEAEACWVALCRIRKKAKNRRARKQFRHNKQEVKKSA